MEAFAFVFTFCILFVIFFIWTVVHLVQGTFNKMLSYKCLSCDNEFSSSHGTIFTPVRCPHCGSLKVSRILDK